eukprot:scaffold2987_cov105-Isochrysis_galbana.AAC.2
MHCATHFARRDCSPRRLHQQPTANQSQRVHSRRLRLGDRHYGWAADYARACRRALRLDHLKHGLRTAEPDRGAPAARTVEAAVGDETDPPAAVRLGSIFVRGWGGAGGRVAVVGRAPVLWGGGLGLRQGRGRATDSAAGELRRGAEMEIDLSGGSGAALAAGAEQHANQSVTEHTTHWRRKEGEDGDAGR